MDEFTPVRIGNEAQKLSAYLRSRNLRLDEMLAICSAVMGFELRSHRQSGDLDIDGVESNIEKICERIKSRAYTNF